jgi:sulfur relay (sulfurtransferase) DsrC/TusE family protein
MLKRYQILLSDWLGEYVKFISEKYDMSFSEATRALLCLATIECISELYPEYKTKMRVKDFVREVKKMLSNGEKNEEEFHRLMSIAYFEARKATEYRISKGK